MIRWYYRETLCYIPREKKVRRGFQTIATHLVLQKKTENKRAGPRPSEKNTVLNRNRVDALEYERGCGDVLM